MSIGNDKKVYLIIQTSIVYEYGNSKLNSGYLITFSIWSVSQKSNKKIKSTKLKRISEQIKYVTLFKCIPCIILHNLIISSAGMYAFHKYNAIASSLSSNAQS